MSNYIFINIPRVTALDEQVELEWLKCHDVKDELKLPISTESELTGRASIDEMKAIMAQNLDSIKIFIVPGEDVRAIKVTLPNKSKAARSTIPFQLEEHLSSKIEQVHIATTEAKNNSVDTLSVEHQKMALWKKLADQIDIQLDYMLVDYTLIPADNKGSVWSDGVRVLVNSTEFQGALTPLLFNRLQASFWPQAIEPSLDHSPTLTCYTSSQSVDVYPESVESSHMALLPLLAKSFAGSKKSNIVNLLQSEYAIVKDRSNHANRLKLPLLISAFLVIMCLILAIIGNYQLEEKHAQIKQKMVGLYQQLYPNDRRINNPFSQMQGKLKQGSQQQGPYFLKWLTIISPPLKQENITVINLKYDLKPLAMRMQLEAEGYSTLEKLVEQLNKKGEGLFVVTLGSLQKSSINQKVTSIITVREA